MKAIVRPTIAAWLYTFGAAGLTLFQRALAAGAPWGECAMGGAFPGPIGPYEFRPMPMRRARSDPPARRGVQQ